MKHPETCGNSIGFDGIYICRLCQLPCERVEECPKVYETKPCPFCGGDFCLSYEGDRIYGCCWDCGAKSSFVERKEKITKEDIAGLRKAWNRRYETVVRCKDCKYWGPTELGTDCHHKDGPSFMSETGFCSRGERRRKDHENENNK